MRQEKFKMERQGLINVGDEIEISEYQSFMNYSYIIEPAVAMSGCYPNAQRIKTKKGNVKKISKSYYDSKKQTVNFTTKSFSKFAVGGRL